MSKKITIKFGADSKLPFALVDVILMTQMINKMGDEIDEHVSVLAKFGWDFTELLIFVRGKIKEYGLDQWVMMLEDAAKGIV